MSGDPKEHVVMKFPASWGRLVNYAPMPVSFAFEAPNGTIRVAVLKIGGGIHSIEVYPRE